LIAVTREVAAYPAGTEDMRVFTQSECLEI